MKQKILLLEALNILQLDKNAADVNEVWRAVARLHAFAKANSIDWEEWKDIEVKVR